MHPKIQKIKTSVKESGHWITFITSVFVMATAGSLFAFSSFSEPFRVAMNYSAQDINYISSFGYAAFYLAFSFIGPVEFFFNSFFLNKL